MILQKQSQIRNEILQGNLLKLMFKLSAPGILVTLLSNINAFIDALFAGQFMGETAIAGISLALPLTEIIDGFAFLVGTGSASVLSRAIGAGDIKTQSKIFGNLIIMGMFISFFITIIGYSFSYELIKFMGGDGQVAFAGSEYFKTYILGSVFYILAVASNQLIKSEGKVRLAMTFAAIYVIINIILNPIFVVVFHWGIQGIALATVIAMIGFCLINFTYFLSAKSSIPVNPRKFAIAINLLPGILSVGISALLASVMDLVQSFIVFKSISYFGTKSDIAFYGATLRLTSLAFIPLNGFVQALQPVIGINYGAGNYERLKKAYFIFTISVTALAVLFWLPMQLSPEILLSWLLPNSTFTNNDLLNFRILSLLIPIMAFVPFGSVFFQSIGKAKTVSIIIILHSIVLFIPSMIILSKFLGVNGVYYGMVTTHLLLIIIALSLTFGEFKKMNTISKNNHC
ncbi:MAG: MATE family efflux transporter [Nostoc sp. DedQUE12b]|uniref:MATE family efflux transporter n=1 Tax=Nostoc sp. DedQUE12b TaxID=3075398 RepID=UPI002AD3C1C8|nr:MATE family efflux transporter [Nostoc sp. DedQUE12b]MDZ8084269.1 MATE family efflux transporter [Nostoc sp. DedQUE12b]